MRWNGVHSTDASKPHLCGLQTLILSLVPVTAVLPVRKVLAAMMRLYTYQHLRVVTVTELQSSRTYSRSRSSKAGYLSVVCRLLTQQQYHTSSENNRQHRLTSASWRIIGCPTLLCCPWWMPPTAAVTSARCSKACCTTSPLATCVRAIDESTGAGDLAS